MKNPAGLFAAVFMILLLIVLIACTGDDKTSASSPAKMKDGGMRIELPEPKYDSDVSLEESLAKRRSIRRFTDKSLTLPEVSQLLWAAQGLTSDRGGRTAPSAGALYPLEVYVIVGNVQSLAAGVYRYEQQEHDVVMIAEGDLRLKLADAALGQTSIEDSAISIVISAIYRRTTRKYGDRGVQYVHLEIGHAGQNICLQATSLGLGSVTIGAFNDWKVGTLLGLPGDREPLYIIPVGNR